MPSTETIAQPENDAPATSPILLHSIELANLLSFGRDATEIPLASLNILVGANGSGKSNFIDAIALLRSTPGDMAKVIRDGGGVQEWVWKGEPKFSASIQVNVQGIKLAQSLNHLVAFYNNVERFLLVNEAIVTDSPLEDEGGTIIYSAPSDDTSYDFASESMQWNGVGIPAERGSVLSRLRDPVNHPEITYLADQYERIRIYREWHFGRNSLLRKPQAADMPLSYLAEDFSNLGLFLNRLCGDPKTKKTIVSYLRKLYDGVDDLWFDVVHGFVQLNLIEGEHKIPASRLSDGTLHYLCLLAILCDPKPPPLLCIEEPELGLHPDILPNLADLLVDASTRTQLIVTTHSHMIVDSMTDRPEAILICEKREGQTSIERLDPARMQIWLDKYSLGELWTSGELGGTRW